MKTFSVEVPEEMAEQFESALTVLKDSVKAGKETFDDVHGIIRVAGQAHKEGKSFQIETGQLNVSEHLRRLYGRACGFDQNPRRRR